MVIGYRVLHVDVPQSRPKLNYTVQANVSWFEVKGLNPFTNYCIQVLAFTGMGDGNISDCLITLTGESGKYINCFPRFF